MSTFRSWETQSQSPFLVSSISHRLAPDQSLKFDFALILRCRKVYNKAKVPQVCTHGLRGTHATLAEAAGVTSHVVAASLGHVNDQVTGRHYTMPEAETFVIADR